MKEYRVQNLKTNAIMSFEASSDENSFKVLEGMVLDVADWFYIDAPIP